MPTVDYKKLLLKDLKDLEYAAGYLSAAMEENEETFLLAVRDVVEAHGGMGALAKATRLNRENLYDMLSEKGNPRLSSVMAILKRLGFEMSFRTRAKRPKAA